MDNQNCGNCRFQWAGFCRRYPEATGTADERWCGEWQENKPAPTQDGAKERD